MEWLLSRTHRFTLCQNKGLVCPLLTLAFQQHWMQSHTSLDVPYPLLPQCHLLLLSSLLGRGSYSWALNSPLSPQANLHSTMLLNTHLHASNYQGSSLVWLPCKAPDSHVLHRVTGSTWHFTGISSNYNSKSTTTSAALANLSWETTGG